MFKRPHPFAGLLLVALPLGMATLIADQLAVNPGMGTVRGVVRFTGKVPPAQEILTTEGLTVVHRDLVVDDKTKGLRDVAVVMESAVPGPKATGTKPVVVDQKGMMFVPRVVVVRHGQAVRFENSDGCNHSVMAASTVGANAFNVFINGDRPHVHTFEPQKHAIPLTCALHAWMKGWIYVVPHPWYALTAEKGTFRIDDVPAGKQTFWLRHTDSGLSERRTVQVEAGKTAEIVVEWRMLPEPGR